MDALALGDAVIEGEFVIETLGEIDRNVALGDGVIEEDSDELGEIDTVIVTEIVVLAVEDADIEIVAIPDRLGVLEAPNELLGVAV